MLTWAFLVLWRKYVPELKDFPDKYIYQPWTAPLELQKAANCIVGTDYPQPMINHQDARRDCIGRLRGVYQTLVCKGKSLWCYFNTYQLCEGYFKSCHTTSTVSCLIWNCSREVVLIRSSRCGNILNGIFGANKKLGGRKLVFAGVLLAKILNFLLHNFRKETTD